MMVFYIVFWFSCRVRLICFDVCVFFFFKQKTAYEMRISDWSSDVCSSDLTFALMGLAGGIAGVLYDDARGPATALLAARSEERSGEKECVSTGRSRWSTDH